MADTPSYVAALKANALPGNIKSGITLAGVTGTFAPTLCAADGAGTCMVDGPNYKAASMTNAVTGNILSGVTIAGVLGSWIPPTPCGFGENISASCILNQHNASTYPLFATFAGGGDPVVYGTTNSYVNNSVTTTFSNVINYAFKANETRWFKIPYTGCSAVEDDINFTATQAFTAKIYDRDLINNTGTMSTASAKGSYPYNTTGSAGGNYYADLTHLSLIGWACDSVANTAGGTSYQYVLITNGATAQTITASFLSVGY